MRSEVSPLYNSGLTPWRHNKRKEQIQTRLLDPEDDDDDDDDARLAIFFRGPHHPEGRKQGVTLTLWRLEVTQA